MACELLHRLQHTLADVIRFRLLMIAAGYEDGNDAAGLRRDQSKLKAALKGLAAAEQPQ